MKKDPKLYVIHILECIEYIEDFTKKSSKEEFIQNKMCYYAVLHNLQTLAESTKRLPPNILDNYPDTPWKDIIGFRNILVHDYLEGLDSDILWDIVHIELPKLKDIMLTECPDWEAIKEKKNS